MIWYTHQILRICYLCITRQTVQDKVSQTRQAEENSDIESKVRTPGVIEAEHESRSNFRFNT